MSRVPRWLKNKERSLKKRISQSMRDAGRANGNCKRLQRQWSRAQKARRALRGL
jgi:hypothetical protein